MHVCFQKPNFPHDVTRKVNVSECKQGRVLKIWPIEIIGDSDDCEIFHCVVKNINEDKYFWVGKGKELSLFLRYK